MTRWMVKSVEGGPWKEVEAPTKAEALTKAGVDARTGFAAPIGQGLVGTTPRYLKSREAQRCPKCFQDWVRHLPGQPCPPPPEKKKRVR